MTIPIEWVTGGDGVCRQLWERPTTSVAAGSDVLIEECGGVATRPVKYLGEPHLVCLDCEGPFLEKSGAEPIEA